MDTNLFEIKLENLIY